MTQFKPGQRWISSAEPDLGMGRVLKVEDRLVTMYFDLIDEVRRYAMRDAPLTRVRFNIGDHIRAADDVEITVNRVTERDGIYVYQGNYRGTETAVIESDLDPNVTFSKPEERLFTLQIDDNRAFNLRYETLRHRARLATLPARGLLGPRVSLIPHQFYIADEVASRYAPRVLLADEVGLGKTIEAGLIIHEQLQTGRASRVMIVVPQALSFQWFVEMIRRFNLQFTLLDEARLEDIEADNESLDENADDVLDNPFEAQQLVLCSTDLFTDNPGRLEQACEADWDLVVVDEAHHLEWLDGNPGADYLAIEKIAAVSRGLLLLTATPEQLGRQGHFSRLRLLDPSRYHSYEEFLVEETQYESIAALINELDRDPQGVYREIRQRLGEFAPADDTELVTALLDRHGTGRVLFRNIRESVKGFRQRKLLSHELAPERFPASSAAWQQDDPRNDWLIDRLQQSPVKHLVICSRADTAIALEKHIRERTPVRSVAFHEHMDLVARDRAANYFADEDRGAQVLVCSEIGSEGRNFQFAHHLVMFDLPQSPDLLEQRIGRLDRIGQKNDVEIHVPWAKGTEQETRLRIYDEGLGIFTRPNAAAQAVFEALPALDNLEQLVPAARNASDAQLETLARGRDRLLEKNSHQPEVSSKLLSEVSRNEVGDGLEDYMELSFAHFGLESDPLGENVMNVKPNEGMVRHDAVSLETQDRFRYPELPEEGLSYTYHRDTALAREDVLFLTWEHPITQQAMDMAVSDVSGNNTVVVTKIAGVKAGTLLVETLHIIECIAPARLNADRYLPPSLVRTLVTPDGRDVSGSVAYSFWDDQLDIPRDTIARIVGSQKDGIRKLLEKAGQIAAEKFDPIRSAASSAAINQFTAEVERLSALAKINPNVRTEEIEFLEQSRTQLKDAIQAAQIRLDAVRIIIAA